MRKNSSKHYSSEEWVDFAMQQMTQPQRAEMQRHIDSGCRDCALLASLWQRVGKIAGREHANHPPESAVRHVQAAFSTIAKAQSERLPLIPRLAFDSLWRPALAGLRSVANGSRKLLYKSKDITIELHIEAESKSDRMNLAGQILIGSNPGETTPPITVTISGEETRLAETSTNSFGEFHLCYVPEAELQISFELVGGLIVVIPLSDPLTRSHRRI